MWSIWWYGTDFNFNIQTVQSLMVMLEARTGSDSERNLLITKQQQMRVKWDKTKEKRSHGKNLIKFIQEMEEPGD